MIQVLKRYSGINVDSIYKKIIEDLLPLGEYNEYIIQSISMVKENAMVEAIVVFQKGR